MGSDYGLGMGLLMNYLSVCSGIEAATVAWHDMGWKPIGFSEIEKFPSQLLQHHYPHVTNYGDMTKFKEWNINEPVNLLVGGTPCQSFSVAGLRKGLEDPRGNLMLTYLGIADHFKPKWILWENVPGVLSSNGGKDFACFLQGLAELGYGFAYRVLDAQHFGVPQRRRRVFVVGCLGNWRSAAKVLFESESLCRDITPSREKGKEIANCLKASPSSYSSFNPARSEGNAVIAPYETSGTLLARDYKGIDSYDYTKMAVAYNITFCDANGTRKDRPNGGLYVNETDTSNTLTVAGVGTNVVSYGFEPGITKREGNPSRFSEEISPTIRAQMGDNQVAVAIGVDTYNGTESGDIAVTMTAAGGSSTHSGPKVMTNNPIISWDSELNPNIDKMGTLMRGGQGGRMDGVMHNMAVRRLTPMECERLQGFPDSYTDIKPNGKPTPDGHRYKALGNSMAVPVMKWIGQRINELS